MGCATSAPCHADPEAIEGGPESSQFHQEFLLGQKLGAGSFGSVYGARRVADGHGVAVKVLSLEEGGEKGSGAERKRRRAIRREVSIMRQLPTSDNIIKFHGLYTGEGLAYLVVERCCMGILPLLERAPVVTEATLRPMFADMLAGIAACHSAGIAHRDVKGDNFLVQSVTSGAGDRGYTVKLCDFGLAVKASSAEGMELEGVTGTPPYMSPEMLSGRRYSTKVDVWALGVIAYVLLYGTWPYVPTVLNGAAMKDAIRTGAALPAFRARPGLPEISEECGTWVRALLRRDPARRLSAEQALRLKSFHAEWTSTVSLEKTVKAAVRCGAFEVPGNAKAVRGELDQRLGRLNAKCHLREGSAMGLSEVSTEVGHESSARCSA